jgi:hypothetical protein
VPFPASTPEPTYGSNEGVDCRTLDVIEVWSVAHQNDEIRAWPWVRHPTGIWAVAEGYLAPASSRGHRFTVPVRGADRIYIQNTYTTTITRPGTIAYGRLTAPVERLAHDDPDTFYDVSELTVRFGAVQAPDEYQRTERLNAR